MVNTMVNIGKTVKFMYHWIVLYIYTKFMFQTTNQMKFLGVNLEIVVRFVSPANLFGDMKRYLAFNLLHIFWTTILYRYVFKDISYIYHIFMDHIF